MAVPVSDLQIIAPSAVIELFELELNLLQHGVTDVYRFHAGTSLNASGQLTWNGNAYLRFPVEAEGFEYSGNGQLPRPKVRVSNILGTITAVILSLPKGIEGAKFTRIRTLARYLDAVNFPGSINPYGTPDPTAEFPREIFYVDRKVTETRDVIEFELAAVFDLAGVRAPKRQCIANICQWQYKSVECGWSPATSVSGTYISKFASGRYTMSGTTITVTATSHGLVAGDYAYFNFPAIAGTFSWSSTTLTVTSAAHGFINGNRVYLELSDGAPSDYYTIGGVTTNTFTVTVTSTASTVTGTVNIFGDARGGYYTVATATTNTLTLTSGVSAAGTTTSTVDASMLKLTVASHSFLAGQTAYFDFTSGLLTSDQYVVGAVDSTTIWLRTTSVTATSGNVSIVQWYDDSDTPVASASIDSCGKRLSSCKQRFGANAELPFGSFPGIGSYYA